MPIAYPLLVIEGSGVNISGALFSSADQVIDFALKPDQRSFSEKILAALDSFLTDQGMSINDIGSLGVSRGPGSFTSVRVGLASTLGLSTALNIPIYTYSSLAAMAKSYRDSDHCIAPFLKAGRGQIYGACFEPKTLIPLIDEGVFDPAEFIQRVRAQQSGAIFCGPEDAGVTEVLAEIKYPEARFGGELILQNPVLLQSHQLSVNYLKEPDLG